MFVWRWPINTLIMTLRVPLSDGWCRPRLTVISVIPPLPRMHNNYSSICSIIGPDTDSKMGFGQKWAFAYIDVLCARADEASAFEMVPDMSHVAVCFFGFLVGQVRILGRRVCYALTVRECVGSLCFVILLSFYVLLYLNLLVIFASGHPCFICHSGYMYISVP